MQCDPGCPLAEPVRWAPIEGTAYLVSNYGQVRRGDRPPLRAARNSDGYLKVGLGWSACEPGCTRHKARTRGRRRGHLRQEYVHRLMYAAFIGPIPDGLTVEHRDGRQRHNRLDNFELLTSSDNTRAAWARRRCAATIWEADAA